MSWGKTNRLSRLKGDAGFFFLIALDHGISVGPLNGLVDFSICGLLSQSAVSGFVVNPGSVSRITSLAPKALVIQLMATPNKSGVAPHKVSICSAIDAVALSADAVSVQINYADFESPRIFRELCKMIRDADRLGLPVLCMVNTQEDNFAVADLNFVLRVLSDVGVDLIKVPLPDVDPQSLEFEQMSSVVRASAAVLVSGGPLSNRFLQRISIAAAAGFAGVCLGRNIFQAPDPLIAVERVSEAFPKPAASLTLP